MGTQVGRYEIISELGRGGMAVVYLARDPLIKRQVAVKVLPRQFTFDPHFRDRFQREAEIIASLEDPAIVPIYDFGEYDEQPFIVMRYMAGGSLAARLAQRGALPLAETTLLFRRLAPGLDKAHRQGIIHRDLKPGNILFDSDQNPYISDFGIAKITTGSTATASNVLVGTPAYMSPEQVHGDQPLDGRSDLYAMGIVLFEMLTGEVPYTADTPAKQMLKHLLAPVPALRAFRADLPAGCEHVLHRALAKEPTQRFGTMVEMVEALQGVVGGATSVQSSKAVGPPTRVLPQRSTALQGRAEAGDRAARKKRSQHPVPVFVLAGGALLLLLGIAGVIMMALMGPGGETPQRAALATEQTEGPKATVLPIEGERAPATEPLQRSDAVTAGRAETATARSAPPSTATVRVAATTRVIDSSAVRSDTAEEAPLATRPPATPLSPTFTLALPTPTVPPAPTVTRARPEPRAVALTLPPGLINNTLSGDYAATPPNGISGFPFQFAPDFGMITTQADVPVFHGAPTEVRVSTRVHNPQRVLILFTGGNVFEELRGQEVGRFRLLFDGADDVTVPLVVGSTLREWKLVPGVVTTVDSSLLLAPAWEGYEAKGEGPAVIDMLRVELDAYHQEHPLTGVVLEDFSATHGGALNPAINLIAITVYGSEEP